MNVFAARRLLAVAACLLAVLGPAPASPATMPGMPNVHGRYLGKPDLALTSALLAAGDGASTFSSARLLGVLAGRHRDAEIRSLRERFGTERTARFFRTFDAFIADTVRIVKRRRISLPPAQPALARNSWLLGATLRRAGVMPDGRFDIGYLIEHLVSRPVHVSLMRDIDANPAFGPAANGDFHLILTAVMNDLKRLDRLPN